MVEPFPQLEGAGLGRGSQEVLWEPMASEGPGASPSGGVLVTETLRVWYPGGRSTWGGCLSIREDMSVCSHRHRNTEGKQETAGPQEEVEDGDQGGVGRCGQMVQPKA